MTLTATMMTSVGHRWLSFSPALSSMSLKSIPRKVKSTLPRQFFSTQRSFYEAEDTSSVSSQQQRRQQLAIEWEQRCQLAVSYRIAYLHDWHMNIFNHITLKVHGSENEPNGPYFFLNNFGSGFDEVTASNLLKVDLNGNIVKEDNDGGRGDDEGAGGLGQANEEQRVFQPGYVIHSAIHLARPDVVSLAGRDLEWRTDYAFFFCFFSFSHTACLPRRDVPITFLLCSMPSGTVTILTPRLFVKRKLAC